MTGPIVAADLAVVIAFGGSGAERDGSRRSAEHVSAVLAPLVRSLALLDLADTAFDRAILGCDVVFNAGHGLGAEDGILQGHLEILGVPFTGSGVLASALCMHKPAFKACLAAAGLPTAPWVVLTPPLTVRAASAAIEGLPGPWFVKPVNGGESFASGPVNNATEVLELLARTETDEYRQFMVEPLLAGNTYTVGVSNHGLGTFVLPVLEARSLNDFYDAEAKQNPDFREYICPAPLGAVLTAAVQELAVRAYDEVGCRGAARVDFMIDDGAPWILEINTVPGFTSQGNLCEILRHSDLSFADFLVAELISAIEFHRGSRGGC
jgi:D-alanine-D-alanine ligase